MGSSGIPHGIHGEHGEVPYRDIYDTFAASTYGEQLSQEIRFGTYKPESVTPEEWCRLLGPDVNNMQHAWSTYLRMRTFLTLAHQSSPTSYSPLGQELLLLTAITHDMGEADVKDHEYGTKTHGLERREIAAIHRITNELVHDRLVSEKIHIAVDGILDGKVDRRAGIVSGTQLQESFEAVEQLDFVRTPIRAWERQRGMEPVQDKPLRAVLRLMGHEIVAEHLQILLDFEKSFPSVRHFILSWRHSISRILADDTREIVAGHPPHKHGDPLAKVLQARELWKTWLEKNV